MHDPPILSRHIHPKYNKTNWGDSHIIGARQDMGNFQRALVFQGGGALGAYEAGTYQQDV
jgi:predicted acylesterase/phospholipase RssA